LFSDLQTSVQQQLLMRFTVVRAEQLRAGCWGERNAALQLGVVVVAGAMPSVCPRVVEDVLTLAVIFQVERDDSEQSAAVLNGDVKRLPPGLTSDTAAFFQREQKRVAGKGVVGPRAIGAAIPFLGVYLGNAVADFRSRRWQMRSQWIKR